MDRTITIYIGTHMISINLDGIPQEGDTIYLYDHKLMNDVHGEDDIKVTKENMFDYDSIRVTINKIRKVYSYDKHNDNYRVMDYACYCVVDE